MARLAGLWLTAAALLTGCALLPDTRSPVTGCPAGLIVGTLEPLGMPGQIGIAEGPQHSLVTWGDGTRTEMIDGTLSVVAPDGVVLARVGDQVRLTGGHVRPGEVLACGPTR